MQDLEGKCAVVTGAGSGIGRGLALAFRKAGMSLVVADIELDAAKRVASETDGRAIRVDVSSADSVEGLAEEVFASMGEVHVLCNNAGVGISGPLEQMTHGDWRWVLSVNLGGVINGLASFLPRMRAQGAPSHIVNTASVTGVFSLEGLGVYSASKAAVLSISETLRTELVDSNIGVTVLCPGSVRTNIMEAARNRPASLADTGSTDVAPQDPRGNAIDPEELGLVVCQAVRDNTFYVAPLARDNAPLRDLVHNRFSEIEAALDREWL
jgi:NAD(P)-dependent dehydrogenase (short-subunit alcohol dehydrogenase family)